ncbi:hypothetical protein CO614_02105 [Lysobacteraceae bacterium NML120232]|nr:hypothetical protein CO608_06965 [Xanthomonadaceae bacterium NML08-0793]PJK13185.1 hypothetical protein CO614_02105 [Xanthomonadaceae bacterium NML120232]
MPVPRSTAMRSGRQTGFTLLEAIVALVIMATTLLALYAWLGSNTIAAGRAQAVHSGLIDARTALEVLEGINPMQEEEGSRDVGEMTIRWRAEPITDRRTGITQSNSAAPFDFTLYQLHVETLRAGQVTHAFSLRKAGWIATMTLSEEDL